MAGREKRLSSLAVGFFPERLHLEGTETAIEKRFTAFDVTVTGRGKCRDDADQHAGTLVPLDDLGRVSDRFAESLGGGNDVVGGHDQHRRVGVFLQNVNGREADAGSRI